MIVSYVSSPLSERIRAIEPQEGFTDEEAYAGFPWKYTSSTSSFVVVFNPKRVENILVEHSFQKLSERGLDFWSGEEAISDKEILKAASKDDTYAFLLSPEEDIYSLKDGRPFNDKK